MQGGCTKPVRVARPLEHYAAQGDGELQLCGVHAFYPAFVKHVSGDSQHVCTPPSLSQTIGGAVTPYGTGHGCIM